MSIECKDKIKRCATCGTLVFAKRSTAKYCSSACRSKAWKARSQPEPPKWIEREDPDLLPHERCQLAELLLRLYKPDFEGFQHELERFIWAIEGEIIPFEWVIYELKFQLKHKLTSSEYSSHLYDVQRATGRSYLLSSDLIAGQ